MPRLIPANSMPFGSPPAVPLSSGVGSPFGASSFSTPKFSSPNSSQGPGLSSSSSSSSVRLSCSSPGGRAVHSLSVTTSGDCFIITHSLPLEGTVDARDNSDLQNEAASVIRTRLPEIVASALSRYPPIELLCVDVHSPPTTISTVGSTNRNRERALVNLPSLCIYTKKDAFLLNLSYEATGAREVEGIVSDITEPYEDALMGNSLTNILRIRQAPQKYNGYPTLCPVGAMAMLTQNLSSGEYCLCIYHGSERRSSSSTISINPVAPPTSHFFRMEELADPNENFVDFCFCQSVGLPLLSSLTVALLKVSGEVLFATPIVFHGTVVPGHLVAQTVEFLQSSLQEAAPDSATWRQLRIAKQFFVDAFPNNGNRSNFVTLGQADASTNGRNRSKQLAEVFNWPIQLQGPILLPTQLESSTYGGSAGCIEPFAKESDLAGLSIGYLEEMVDVAVLSPSSFIPRFKFESTNDSYDLDQELTMGCIINRVDLGGSTYSAENNNVKDIKLISDPVMNDVIHYMTANQIISISTNAARIASNQIRENEPKALPPSGGMFSPHSRRRDTHPKTSAWNSLDASFFQGGQNPIVGAIVSEDVQLGHILVARLLNGEMIAINLTETRHLRELENFAEPKQGVLAIQDERSVALSQAEEQALASLDQKKALADIVQPLIKDVIKGITGLAQVGGTSTSQADVTPDVLAGVVGIEGKCKKEIFLPLMTMNEHVSARRAEFKSINDKQKQQLLALKEMIATMREKQNLVKERSEIMIQNSKSLADRSASVLQSSKDLLPTITQAEYDYFQELKRLDDKSRHWKQQVERLSLKVESLRESLSSVGPANGVNLTSEYKDYAGQLLMASGQLLKKYEKKLAAAEDDLDSVATTAGFVRDANQ